MPRLPVGIFPFLLTVRAAICHKDLVVLRFCYMGTPRSPNLSEIRGQPTTCCAAQQGTQQYYNSKELSVFHSIPASQTSACFIDMKASIIIIQYKFEAIRYTSGVLSFFSVWVLLSLACWLHHPWGSVVSYRRLERQDIMRWMERTRV